MPLLIPALALLAASSPTANEPQPWYAESLGVNYASLATPEAEESSKGSPFSYTYLELGAAQLNPDQISEDVDSYYGIASLSLFGFLRVFGEYDRQDLDISDTSADNFALGAGVHFNVLRNLDLVGDVAWLYSDVSSDLANLDDSNDGYEVFGGVRWMLWPWSGGGLELNGGYGFIELDNRLASDDTVDFWEVGARIHFLKFLSLGGTYQVQDDDDAVAANVRFSL